MAENKKIRVLYSFPHQIGASRICYTAWQQVKGLADAGADILLFTGVLRKPLPTSVKVRPTLAWGKLRISYKIVGAMRACRLHDRIVARRIKKLKEKIDIIHCWPLASLRTLETAAILGIPTVLERPNAHTRFALDITQEECEKLGVFLPRHHEHGYDEYKIKREEEEYRKAYRLLCPSDFVVKTFLDKGYPKEQLVRHIYGFDEKNFYPPSQPRKQKKGLSMLFIGVCAVRKGLHYALEAWLQSPASKDGTFLIAGGFLPEYKKKLTDMLSHPSVKALGHRNDVPELMRKSDIVILPSIEEGFGLVCVEALGSGCVPLVSDACTDICKHMENALVHHVGDVKTITEHITMLYSDRTLLEKLRSGALRTAPGATWSAAGVKLLEVYREVIETKSK